MSSSYVKTLYNDYSVKVKSIKKYLDKIENETGELTQATYEWIQNLQEKYKLLDEFEKTRVKMPNSNFMLEPQGQTTVNEPDKLKVIDTKVSQNAEQINYIFEKLGSEGQFLMQSFQDLQNIVNQIYDTWNDLMTMKN